MEGFESGRPFALDDNFSVGVRFIRVERLKHDFRIACSVGEVEHLVVIAMVIGGGRIDTDGSNLLRLFPRRVAGFKQRIYLFLVKVAPLVTDLVKIFLQHRFNHGVEIAVAPDVLHHFENLLGTVRFVNKTQE